MLNTITMEIQRLIEAVDAYLAGQASIDVIEEATTPLIARNEELLTDERISGIVYMLDMRELEELNRAEVIKLRRELEDYIHNGQG